MQIRVKIFRTEDDSTSKNAAVYSIIVAVLCKSLTQKSIKIENWYEKYRD